MCRHTPRSTRPYTRLPDSTHFRSFRNHPMRNEMLPHISLDKFPPIFRAQFTWKGDFDLAGQRGVLALLDRLDAVPQARAIEHPVRRAIGGHDLPMLDVRLARVVVAFAQALVGQPLA